MAASSAHCRHACKMYASVVRTAVVSLLSGIGPYYSARFE